mgnify:CR=1 FL=1
MIGYPFRIDLCSIFFDDFDVVPIGSNDERRELFKNAEQYIGKLLTVQFLGFTDDGKPKIAKGKDINMQDKDGKTALMHTILYYCPEVAKLLIEAGV